MPDWFSVTRVSAKDVDEEAPQDAVLDSGASDPLEESGVIENRPSDQLKQRARYSTSWPAGVTESLEPSTDHKASLSANQWSLLVLFGVGLFICAALVTGVVIGRVVRGTVAAEAATAVPAGSALVAAAQAWTSPDGDRLDPRPVSDVGEISVASLFDAGPTSSDAAPDFQLETLSGDPLSLAALKGRVVVVNFWATWCNWCKYEMPALQAVHRKYSDQGFVVLGVNVEEPRPLVEAYVERYGLSFPVVLDVAGTTAESYKVRALPMTFFIDREGTIVRVQRGAMREDELELYVRNALARD